MLRLITTIVVLVGVSSAAWSAEAKKRTLAVVDCDAGGSRTLADLVATRLADDAAVALVERTRLEQLSDEQSRAAALETVTARVDMGRIVGADVLALLSVDNGPAGAGVRLLLCDTATGARLAQLRVPAGAADAADLVTREIRQTLARFPQGVQSIVVVSDLLSRDLRLEYAHLQATLADVLRDALSSQPGLAVLELDEARAIAQEREVAGGGGAGGPGARRQPPPLFIDAEYRTDALAEGGPTIALTVRLRTARQELDVVRSGAIKLDEAGPFVAREVRRKVLEHVGGRAAGVAGAAAAEDVDQQFTRLVARADEFADVGEFERAAAIREAALLLRPSADEQRVRLVKEYIRWNRRPVEVWPKAAKAQGSDPFWTHVVARCRSAWRRTLGHVEYLVRNRRIDIETATQMWRDGVRTIGARATAASTLTEEEAIKKAFLRHVAPPLLQLDSRTGRVPTLDARSSAAYAVYESCFFRVDGNFLREEDLALTGDLLCELLPADTPVAMVLLYRLRDGTGMFRDREQNTSAEAWGRFCKRLLESDRPLVRAYGRYATLGDRRYRGRERSEELLAEAKSLAADLRGASLAQLDVHQQFHRAVSDEAVWIEMALRPKERKPTVAARDPEAVQPKPVEQPDGSLQCERVRLEPIRLEVDPLDKGKQHGLDGHRWRGAGGYAAWQELVPAWDGVDAIFSRGALLLVGPDRVAREVLVDAKLSIGSVVFDGRYLWASGGYDRGVYALDRNGKVVAHATAAEGLPDAYVNMPLHAIRTGQVLAAGSIGQAGRGWLATIDITGGGKPRVKVIHEAVRPWQFQDTPFEQIVDPAMRFEPDWIVEHTDARGDRFAFVGRRYAPLMVDLKTLDVRVYPIRKLFEHGFPRHEGGPHAYVSRQGLLYVAGSNNDFRVFRMDEATRLFHPAAARDAREWHYGNATGGSLVEHDGWLYYAGERRWLRHHPADGRDEVLVASPRSLPGYGSGGAWRFAVSRCFGLVAWHGGKLYRLQVGPATPSTPSPPAK